VRIFCYGLLTVLLCQGTPGAAAPQPQESGEPTFQVDVSLIPLLVNVKGPHGEPLGDLTREDFTVRDEGVERPIAVFERRTNRPLRVVLMLDASLSTARELQFEQESAKRFLARLLGPGSHRDDRAAVIQFSSFVDLLSGFTNSVKRLHRALGKIRAEGGTSLYDAIVLASEEMFGGRERNVIVVITDGGDTTSVVRFRRALQAAQRADAVIYGIIVTPVRSDAGRNVGGENALKTLAANTGGVTFVQEGVRNLDEAFDEILRSLRTQYLIGYYPPAGALGQGRFRRVEVEVSRPGARVLARRSYFVPQRNAPEPNSEEIHIRPRQGPAAAPDPEAK